MQDKDYVYNLNHSTHKEKQSSEATQKTPKHRAGSGRSSIISFTCPVPGNGVNTALLKAAWACKRAGLSPEAAARELSSWISRTPRSGEIERAVQTAYKEKPKTGGVFSKAIKEKYNPRELQKIASKIGAFGIKDLTRRSPIDPVSCTTLDFLSSLYPQNERVFLTDKFTSREGTIWARHYDGQYFDPQELDFLIKPEPGNGTWFLPNPITGEALLLDRHKNEWNPQGWTIRSEENLTSFRYLVLESDEAPEDLWIKALVQAPVPIVSITTSGGNSIHALVRVNAKSKEHWNQIKDMIAPRFVTLGADPGAITAVRLTRLPGCYRAINGRWQELLFLNPRADGRPIITMPALQSGCANEGRK